ncbi:MAG: hypothetical protein KF893_07550 [Caldilineaceae bacterium]|nr:hypothetical protein [Caldilineaceae bacterium]
MRLGQDEPSGGEIVIGPSVRVGYYAQQHETLDYDSTLIKTIRYAAPITESSAVSFELEDGRLKFTLDTAPPFAHIITISFI